MKKVLVVGGAGYIGGQVTDDLISAGFDVTVYDNLTYEDRYLKPVKFIHGDIRDTPHLVDVAEQFDTIILMAALVGDPACSVNTLKTMSINFIAVKKFCEHIDHTKKHVIFFSTCSVYGISDDVLNEKSPTNPLSCYAESKLAAEKPVLNIGGTVFRLGTVFGLGDTYSRIRLDLVVNVLTMRAINNKKISIFGGDQWRPIISVKDISGYTCEACTHGQRGIYILSKENTQIMDLGKRVSNIIHGTELDIKPIDIEDARNYRVDNFKSIQSFEYIPTVSVEDEVMRMSRMFIQKRIKDPYSIVYNNGAFIRKENEKYEE